MLAKVRAPSCYRLMGALLMAVFFSIGQAQAAAVMDAFDVAALDHAAIELLAPEQANFQRLSDDELSDVSGQALFSTQRINSTVQSGLTFYRLMLDAQLDLNMNIEKMQLGCGGVNNNLDTTRCDIDIDYLTLMGRAVGAGGVDVPGAVGSDFTLMRPYLEFAVKNDGNKATREVIGIKIGAQTANGLMSIGRFNPSAPGCDPNATSGTSALACHSGINSISAYMNADMSATADGSGYLNLFLPVPVTFRACFGNTARTDDLCGAAQTFVVAMAGTRMNDIALPNIELQTEVYGGLLNITAYADVRESLRFIHQIYLNNSANFGLSFQREQVRYPNFNSSTYAVAANTGFWFNLPYVRVRDGYTNVGDVGEMNAAFGSGIGLQHLDLGQRPADNCYGTTTFC